jgi:RNA polymerase-interacting CarD/CdnL/TRCF family regulator
MFKKGDLVLHRHYGVGTVINIQRMKVTEDEQIYYIIDLSVGERLLIPTEQAEELGLSTVVSTEAIISVLSDAPQTLADDFRLRQLEMDQKIGSGDPLRVAEALRDLNWRGQAIKLSTGDVRLMCKAHKFLSSLLAAQPSIDVRSAGQRLDATLKQAVLAQEAAGG